MARAFYPPHPPSKYWSRSGNHRAKFQVVALCGSLSVARSLGAMRSFTMTPRYHISDIPLIIPAVHRRPRADLCRRKITNRVYASACLVQRPFDGSRRGYGLQQWLGELARDRVCMTAAMLALQTAAARTSLCQSCAFCIALDAGKRLMVHVVAENDGRYLAQLHRLEAQRANWASRCAAAPR